MTCASAAKAKEYLLIACRSNIRSEKTWLPTRTCLCKEYDPMEMKQVSDNCFAVLNEKNRVCDAKLRFYQPGRGCTSRHAVGLGSCAADD